MKAGDSSDSSPRVTIQRSNKNRPLAWEDDAPADSRFRRVQPVTPASGRNLPGMPLTMPDPDDDDFPRSGRQRFDAPRGPWWRPESKWGRIFFGLGVVAILGTLATAVQLTRTFLERAARFRIGGSGNIQAAGLSEVTRADVLPVFGEDIGRNIFFVPLSQRRKQLEKIPWVQHATVMRLLPDQLRISVVERKPVAFVRQGQQIGLVDAEGTLLSMPAATMTRHHYSFPVVAGIDANDAPASRRARMAVYTRLVNDLDSTGQHLSEQISEIDLTDPEDARVVMPEQGADILAHFGDDQFLARYQRYKAHIGEWRQQYPKLMAVDLRYDQQVVLKMTPGAGGSGDPEPTGKPLVEPSKAVQETAMAKPSAGVKATPAKTVVHKTLVKPKSAKDKKKHADKKHIPSSSRQKAAAPAHAPAATGQGQ